MNFDSGPPRQRFKGGSHKHKSIASLGNSSAMRWGQLQSAVILVEDMSSESCV